MSMLSQDTARKLTALLSPHPCETEPGEFDHDWKFVSDWYGDPGVINGTADCSRWLCRRCDAEGDMDPPGHDEDDC